MAEVFATASAVAGIISLTVQVIQVSHRYFSSVKNSSRLIKSYFRELELLKLCFSEIDRLLPLEALQVDGGAVAACSEELDHLRAKLGKRKGSSDGGGLSLTRLTWPFADDEMRRVIEMLHRYQESFQTLLIASNTSTLNSALKTLQEAERQKKVELKNSIIIWLSPPEILDNHTAARNKHEGKTGRWIFGTKVFQAWLDSEGGGLLWLKGYPGQGKTILCSTIVDHLYRYQGANDFVTYFYFDFRDERKRTVESALRSMIAQICVRADEVPSEVEDLYHRFRSTNSIARHVLEEVLRSLIDRIGHLTVILDALDESSERAPLLRLLQTSFGSVDSSVKCFVTSRHEQDIEHGLNEAASGVIPLDRAIVDQDIRIHVRACLERDCKLNTRPSGVKSLVEDALVRKAGGMFRWVECQLEVLRRCRNVPQIEAALEDLPPDIDTTYARILWSIDQESREFARRALEILLFAKRPLKLSELAEAVVIEYSSRPFDPGDRLFDIAEIVGICRGLVSWDQDTNLVSLSHYSVREYLLSDRFLDSGPPHFAFKQSDGDCNIAMLCLNYLMSIGECVVGFRDIRTFYPFLEYATIYWLLHAAPSIGDLSGCVTRNAVLFLAASDHASSFWINLLENDWEIFASGPEQNWVFAVSHVLDYLSIDTLLKLLQYGQQFTGRRVYDIWNGILEVLSDRADIVHQDVHLLTRLTQALLAWSPHLLCEPYLLNNIMLSAIEAGHVEALVNLNNLCDSSIDTLNRAPCFWLGVENEASILEGLRDEDTYERLSTRAHIKDWNHIGRNMRQKLRFVDLDESHQICPNVSQPQYIERILQSFLKASMGTDDAADACVDSDVKDELQVGSE